MNHLSTSPKPRESRVTPQILEVGIGSVGCYRMTDQEWDAAVPPEFLRFMQTFDLRTADGGNGRVRATVSGMTDAVRGMGYYPTKMPPYHRRVFPLSFPRMILNVPPC